MGATLWLQCCGSLVVVLSLSCSSAGGIFLDQGLSPSPLLAGRFFTSEPPRKLYRVLFNNRFCFASSDWSISSWFNFGGVYVLETCPFLLGCWICRHVIVHSIPLGFFVFLQYQLLHLLCHFLFCWFGFSILPGQADQRFVSLVYPFKEPGLCFIDFFLSSYLKKNLDFTLFLSYLYYFLLLDDFRFSFPFFSSDFLKW